MWRQQGAVQICFSKNFYVGLKISLHIWFVIYRSVQEIKEDFSEMLTGLKAGSEYGIKDIQHSKGFLKLQ
jgi:heterodisulfide reductase subunit B